jgi:hypothetical protein
MELHDKEDLYCFQKRDYLARTESLSFKKFIVDMIIM